ncbi:MAG: GYD domain-containing protein, partial [Methanobacterium sp.]
MKYVVMGNWTDQGRKTIEDIKKRIETSRNLIEEKNGSISLYYTMGEYDFVSIVDMPDEESL